MKSKSNKSNTKQQEIEVLVDNQRIAVVDCEKLNIRESNSLQSKILGIAVRSEALVVDMKASNKEFLKVVTENGLDGYCKIEFAKFTD